MKHRIGGVQRACWRALVAARGRKLRISRASGSWQRSVRHGSIRIVPLIMSPMTTLAPNK